MGALHAGHLALVDSAKAEHATVAASLFVNPRQFAPSEDFERYPRDFESDRDKLAAAGVDIVFAPTSEEIYPSGFSTSVEIVSVGRRYEGEARPTHFAGVATVVCKLLNIVAPDSLFIGQKDAQQTAMLRHVVRDLAFPTAVVIVPTVRESDGLALSSRNAYLTPQQRADAPSLFGALELLRAELLRNVPKSQAIARATVAIGASGRLEYLDVVDADTFEAIETLRAPAFIIGAARFGATRLLDNLWIAA
ncbi:MAG: pantoate--beta-alanine ligase [Candidatus Eremiobacteraeota bacterium]|nr:pantoate--beta-alanine ligase [Candidatus Eremiobacteraeota bacterium]